MEKIRFLILISALLLTASMASAQVETYAVDAVHSSAFFKVGHYGFGYVRGGFADITGKIVVDKADPSQSSVVITIKTNSIDTGNRQRDEHLKSKDFFDTENHPTMEFKSKLIKKVSNDLYEVTGDFTLHGVTKSIAVPVRFVGEGKDHYGAYKIGFESAFSIKRSEYGMTQYIPAAGDRVDITLVVEGVRT